MANDTEYGRSPDGSGPSAEPEPSSTVSAVPVSVPNAPWLEHVAKAIYAVRPFCMASTATTFGAQMAQSFDWDGAPAYYQSDMLALAKAALDALWEPHEAVLCMSWRPDGGLRIHSPSHPGCVLSHSRADLVMLDVLPVLAEIGFAATAQTGAVHESATAESGDAQPQPVSGLSHTGVDRG